MDYQFSISCKNYIPTIDKCRSIIFSNKDRNDLLEIREFSLIESIIYFNYNLEIILEKIRNKEIAVRTFKTTDTIKLKIPTTWNWDDCCLENSGGICIYYEKHPDAKCIKYSDEIKLNNIKHPESTNNQANKLLPDLENKILEIINSEEYKSSLL